MEHVFVSLAIAGQVVNRLVDFDACALLDSVIGNLRITKEV